MKKIFKVLIFVLSIIALSSFNFLELEASQIPSENYDLLPKGEQYLDPDNVLIEYDSEMLEYKIDTLHDFRIKSNTNYYLYVNDDFLSEQYYFFSVELYDEQNELIESFSDSFHSGGEEFFDSLTFGLLLENGYMSFNSGNASFARVHGKRSLVRFTTDYPNLELNDLNSNEYLLFTDVHFDEFVFVEYQGADRTNDVTIVDYYSSSLQLLDLESWFDYRASDLGTYQRKLKLYNYIFILEKDTMYTLVLNKKIFDDDPFADEDGMIFYDMILKDIFHIYTRSEDENYIIYTLIRTDMNFIFDKPFVSYFTIEFRSKNDATQDNNILDDELKELMLLHAGSPKDNYKVEDFDYKHPLEDKAPVFDGDTYFVTNVNNPFTLNEILFHISVYDEEDGFLEPIVLEDNYSDNKTKIGTYTVKLQAVDRSGNVAELVIIVLVKDVDAPEILGPSKINQSCEKLLTVDEIKNKFIVTDNYDGDITIKIIENNYSHNFNLIGEYKIILKAVDSSGNESTKEFIINVFDDVSPVITGPSMIVKNNNEVLTLSEIKLMFTATDNIDGDISKDISVILDNYSGFGHKVGNYKIILEVSDSSGNKTTYELFIKVLDNIPPVFYIDNFLINVQQGVELSKQDIIDLLIATGQLNNNGTTYITFSLNEYENNEDLPGIYNLKLSSTSTDGTEQDFDLKIKVLEVKDDLDSIIVKSKDFFTKVFNHLLDNWYWYVGGLLIIILILGKNRRRW